MGPTSNFHVIVIGGSVSGLTMALMLEQMGVSYTLLEQGPAIAFAGGASIGLQPHALRIMDQLGLYEDILKTTVPMVQHYHRRPGGKMFSTSNFSRHIEARHGYPILFFEREELLHILYGHLKDKRNVLTSKKVVKLESNIGGVRAVTADGSIFVGDMVVGADGVHSFTRRTMWHIMSETEPELAEKESKAMTCEYACAFGVSIYESDDPDFIPGHAHLTYNEKISSIVILSTRNKIFWFLIFKHDKKYVAPNIPRYSTKDAEAAIKAHAGWQVTETTTIQKLWDHKTKFTMVSLEEVVFERWHQDRLVLLGDSAFKVTPNAGHGGNTAIESAVTLANLLYQARNGTGPHRLDHQGILSIFAEYERTRRKRMQQAFQVSVLATRLHAMDNSLFRLLGLHILPLFGEELEANAATELILGGVPMDFIEYKGKTGTIPWDGWSLHQKDLDRSGSQRLFSRVVRTANWITAALLVAGVVRNTNTSTSVSHKLPFSFVHRQSDAYIHPWGLVSACMDLLPIAVIIAVEGQRRSNARKLPILPLLAAISLLSGGLKVLGGLFLLVYLVDLAVMPVKNPYSFVVPPTISENLPSAVVLCALVTGCLPVAAPLFAYLHRSSAYQSLLSAYIQLFPLMVLGFSEIFSKLNASVSVSESLVQAHLDLNYLKKAYILAMAVASTSRVVTNILGLAHLIRDSKLSSRIALTPSPSPSPILHFILGGSSLPSDLGTAFVLFMLAAMIFVVSSAVAVLPSRSRDGKTISKVAAAMWIATVLLGPGFTVSLLWIWREDKVRCDQLVTLEGAKSAGVTVI
ncbi:hypothetical protein A1O3_00035 [Capronia epimyces CBS 606.96]|uniref:FAD-binding domain-containing protein n=1 Tax=Capronia epimyces CBS 606.96 TaxID=1182542 RepID=W9YF31_9EURO|nr:uncharacterized protein A1O3_00035 [Capronia epimyces CBS 606.96]EXJ91487.1 hypothetical protein A1O3_00035 [Capronia epimyces CBS 606.96]